MRSAELSIDLLPALMRMAVGIIIECCRRTDCADCELMKDGHCFFDNFSSKRDIFSEKSIDK